jgi:hypothetical protein
MYCPAAAAAAAAGAPAADAAADTAADAELREARAALGVARRARSEFDANGDWRIGEGREEAARPPVRVE